MADRDAGQGGRGGESGGDRPARIAAAFGVAYRRRTPFREDREQGPELELEVQPAVEDLLPASGEAPDLAAPEHHEGLALVTRLGRRAAELGITPTAAAGVAPSLVDAFRADGLALPPSAQDTLAGLCLEGYVGAREERGEARAGARAAAATGIIEPVTGCVALVLAGHHPAEQLSAIVDRFGRRAHQRDARACIVDLTDLEPPDPDQAVEVFGADAVCRMLGATCIFAGVEATWREAARAAGVDDALLQLEPTFARALERALEPMGYELRARRGWLGRRKG